MRHTQAVILVAKDQPPILDEVRVDDPGAGEVLVKLRASGICHTDLAAVRDARTYPVVLGHEGAGIVAAVGEGVTRVKAGDHVVINWQPRCGRCRRCVSGRADLCESVAGTITPRVFWRGEPVSVLLQAGTFCEFVVMPQDGVVPIRHDLPFGEAALLGCAVATGVGAAMFTAAIKPGDTVAVIGTGGVGLNIVQGARLAKASTIIAIDLSPERLALASEFGATHTLPGDSANLTALVAEISGGRGIDFVFEVVGLPSLMNLGIDMLSRGGELVLVGAAARNDVLSFAPRSFMSRQQVIRSSIYGNVLPQRHLPLFADWCVDGSINVRRLITRSITLADVPRIFSEAAGTHGMKTIIEWQ